MESREEDRRQKTIRKLECFTSFHSEGTKESRKQTANKHTSVKAFYKLQGRRLGGLIIQPTDKLFMQLTQQGYSP